MRFFPRFLVIAATFSVSAFPIASQAQPLRRIAGFSSTQAEQIVGKSSRAVVRAIQNNDTKTLARYAHPTRGVRFSPYSYVFVPEHLSFKPSQIANLKNRKKVYNWGIADGSGDAIRLNWNGFRQRFLVPRDFSKAQINYNAVQSRGNMANNLDDIYKGAIFTEFHLPSSSQNEMDWRSLWLAWRPVGKNWYLVGVAGDGWTI